LNHAPVKKDSTKSNDFCIGSNDLNFVHPFREGNGRSLLVVCTAIARASGYEFDWQYLRARKEEFDQACANWCQQSDGKTVLHQAMQRPAGDWAFLKTNPHTELTVLFRDAIVPLGSAMQPLATRRHNPEVRLES
jgi:hypothetical protein